MTALPTVSAEPGGFVAPGWGEDRRLLFDARGATTLGWARKHAVEIGDARALQAQAASSSAPSPIQARRRTLSRGRAANITSPSGCWRRKLAP